MSVNNHLGLPEEVFEIILQRLCVEDVLSCSLVCIGWRNAVNSDRIWEKLCKKNISGERLKLRTEYKRVGSSYNLLESETLPRVCSWRTRYMDDIDLKRNWKNGSQEDFTMEFFGDILFPSNWLEADSEVLLMSKWPTSKSYSVFNIVDEPIMTGEIRLALRNHNPSLFKLSNNILVIVQCTLIQVYVKDENNNLKFKFFALFDRDHSETIPDTQDLSNWYNQFGYPSNTHFVRCDHNGKSLVGMSYYYGPRYSPLHIWDLESQTKVQEVAFPWQMPGELLSCASFFLRDNIIHTILAYHSCTSIYSYDIDKSSYSKTCLQLQGCLGSVLCTETVALMSGTNFREKYFLFFDLRDGRKLDTTLLQHRGPVQAIRVQAFGNIITYSENTGEFPSVTVYDTEKLCLVDKFPVKSRSVSKIHIVMDDLILINTERHLLIRDIKKREILRSVECLNFLPPDPSCSKIVVQKPENELAVLHFW